MKVLDFKVLKITDTETVEYGPTRKNPKGKTETSEKTAEVFISKVELKTGDIIYIAMEELAFNYQITGWDCYKWTTLNYTRADIRSKPEIIDISKIFSESETKTHLAEIKPLIENLSQKDIKALIGISSGAQGFEPKKGRYVTYVSRKPVVGLFPFPKQLADLRYCSNWNKNYDFDNFIKNYNDIVISVGSYLNGEEYSELDSKTPLYYTHRGIFRNIVSMLKKDYKGLAMLIHSFTAYSWKKKFSSIEFMQVNPDNNELMRSMLLNEFSKKELFTNSFKTDFGDYTDKFIDKSRWPEWIVNKYKDDNIVININSLSKKFKELD